MSETGNSVVNTFVDLINSNITNPNQKVTDNNLKWVFGTIGKMDVQVYPRVNVINPTSGSAPHELGSTNQRFAPRIEIQVRVKKDTVMTINSTSMTDIEVLDYLSKQITDLLRTTTSRATMLSNDSVFYSVLEAENTVYGDYVLIRQLIFKNILKR